MPNPALPASEAVATTQFVGDAVCTPCHREISARHSQSSHARTLAAVSLLRKGDLFRREAKFTDPGNGTTYQPTVRQGRCWLQSRSVVETRNLPAEIAVGSGRHGQTYLGREGQGPWLALRLSYYAGAKGWDYTPGQFPDPNRLGEFNGQTLEHGQLEGCLACHVTTLKMSGEVPDKAKTRFGIGCERCHGGGRAHVAAMRARPQERAKEKYSGKTSTDTTLENLSLATAARLQQICATCHRADANAQAGGTTDPVSLSRFKSTAFALSKCVQKSQNFSCITCHDAHRNATQKDSDYEAVCRNCHTTRTESAPTNVSKPAPLCTINPSAGCIRCHMPAQTPETFPHTRYHNHWIRIWKDGK